MNTDPPLPYRLKSSSLRFHIPEIGASKLLPDTRFIRAMRNSQTWQTFKSILFTVRTWARATIWGDRVREIQNSIMKSTDCHQLFLQFYGPSTILLQTRASRIGDVLTSENVNEIADTQPGWNLSQERSSVDYEIPKASSPVTIKTPRMSAASIGIDGKVIFEPIGSKT